MQLCKVLALAVEFCPGFFVHGSESWVFLNHAQFEEPGVSVSEDNFAQITNTLNDGRTFQFTLNLAF